MCIMPAGAADAAGAADGLQRALGRRLRGARARVGLHRHPHRARERLEGGLGLVMRVRPAQVVHVQRHLRVVHEALEEFVHQVDVELADPRPDERDVELEPRPPREVDHHARERLVERDVGVPEPAYALLVADRLRHRLAEGDPDVLDGVVGVDVQVALRLDVEVEQAVARDLVEHVVEERHAGGELRLPGAVEVDRNPDLGFGRLAGDRGVSHTLSARADSSKSFSPGVPTVSRRQLASSGWLPWKFRTRMLRAFRRASMAAASRTRTRMKLASLGNASTPVRSARRSNIAARSALMRSAWPWSTSMCASSRSETCCAMTLTLYGGRTLSNSRIHSGCAAA